MHKKMLYVTAVLMTTFSVALALEFTPTQSTRSLTPKQCLNTLSTEPIPIEANTGSTLVAQRYYQPITIEQGEISHYGYRNEGFDGATLCITNPVAWSAFWQLHKATDCHPPRVDFEANMVIAVIQGLQTSGGGPNISVMDIRPASTFTTVDVFDDRRPGMLDVITNPYHIVQVSKRILMPTDPVAFHRVKPIPDTGVVIGRVFAATPDGVRKPLPFAVVTLWLPGPIDDTSNEAPELMPVEVRSGLDGSFHFANVPSIRSVITTAERWGFEPQKDMIGIPPNARVSHDFVLKPALTDDASAETVPEQTPALEPSPS